MVRQSKLSKMKAQIAALKLASDELDRQLAQERANHQITTDRANDLVNSVCAERTKLRAELDSAKGEAFWNNALVRKQRGQIENLIREVELRKGIEIGLRTSVKIQADAACLNEET